MSATRVGERLALCPTTLPTSLFRYLPDYLRQSLEEEPRRGTLLNALERLRSTLYLLGTYLPRNLVQEVLRQPLPGRVHGQLLEGTLLFADVSGFTALSERLAVQGPEGAEQLTDVINRYMERMLEILSWSGGVLQKFAGDALLAHFAALKDAEQARWAVRAAQRMMRAMGEFTAIETGLGPVALRIKIGITSGTLLAAAVGSTRRMEYILLGPPVTRVMQAEGAATAGQIVVDQATAAALDPGQCTEQVPGFFAVQPAPEEEIGEIELSPETLRRTRGTSLLASDEELRADLDRALEQLEALVPYLPAELVERIIAGSEQRQVESEFRPATVLFGNMTGWEELLPEEPTDGDAQALTHRLSDSFTAIYEAVSRYGGTIARIDPYKRGSKLLILFGAPVAHEDDPQRAGRAAIAMMAEANGRIRPPTSNIHLSIGITQGPTLAGQAGSPTRREYTVMGDDVNLAARLMSAAQPGQILLSQAVQEAVRDDFYLTTLPPIRVKGKSEPVAIYQVDGPRDDRLLRRLRSRGPLVGRKEELAQSFKLFEGTMQGQGGRLTIQGPAGIGKSALADALAATALERGAHVLAAECSSYTAGSPYSPWITLLQAAAGIGPVDSPDEGAAKLRRLLEALALNTGECAAPLANLLGFPAPAQPDLALGQNRANGAPTKPARPARASLFALAEGQGNNQKGKGLNLWQLSEEKAPAPKASPSPAQASPLWQRLETRVADRERTRLWAAVDRLLEALSVHAPLLLYLENAQWMDAPSQELLDYVAGKAAARRLLLLVVRREEGVAAAGAGLALGPLSQEDSGALVAHLLGQPTIEEKLVQAVYARSGGNPLLVEEIARRLQHGGQAGVEAVAAIDALPASRLVQELVLSRLDTMPPSQRTTAKAASVVGDEFAAGDIRPLLSERTVLGEALDGLEEERLTLLVEQGQGRYAFRQTLVRELVYKSQPFARRRQLHARFAAELESRLGDQREQYAELLAYHYELARQPLAAARYLLLSGHRAGRRFAYPEADGYYRRALAALERLPAEQVDAEALSLRTQAYEGLGDTAVRRGEWTAAVESYAAAAESYTAAVESYAAMAESYAAAQAALPAFGARLLVKQALVLPLCGQAGEAEQHALQAWPEGGLAAAAVLAWLSWRRGAGETREWITRATALARSATGQWATRVAALLADLSGDWPTARAGYLALGQSGSAALAACREGDRELHAGNLSSAAELYEQAAALWQGESDAAGLALARYRQAEAHWRSGDTARVEPLLREALGLLGPDSADRAAAQQALDALRAGQPGWPLWRWQRYEDEIKVALLFEECMGESASQRIGEEADQGLRF